MCALRILERRAGESRWTKRTPCVTGDWHVNEAMMPGIVRIWNPVLLKSADVKKVCINACEP